MKMKKTALSILVFAASAALVLTGCARSAAPQDSSPTAAPEGSSSTAVGFEKGSVIGVSLPQKTSENWVLAEALFTQDIADAGFTPIVQFANAGVAEQQNQISAMITKGAKVIIVGAIDGSQLGTQLKQAKDAGITVIAYDRLLTNTTDVDFHVAFDSFKIGVFQGESLLLGLATKKASGPYNIELFAGSPDDANAKLFFEGAMSVLQPKIDDGTLVVASGNVTFNDVATLGWLPANGQKRMDALLVANYSSTTLDGVLMPNDTLARTILTSVKAAGKPLPIVTGQDSDVESIKSIMAGEQYSTVDKDTRVQQGRVMKMILSLAAGETVEVNGESTSDVKTILAFLLEPILVTKDNAVEVYKNNPTLAAATK